MERDEITHFLNYRRGLSARVAEACGIARAAVYQWRKVPINRVDTVADVIETVTGCRLSRKDIRPDVYVEPGEMHWPPLPHFISEPERWAELQRSVLDPDTVYGEDQ